MQICWRKVGANEIDHELLWLSVSLGALAVATTWFMLHLPWPRCLFHDLTGLPCATCGATRCTVAFLHGDFLAAWLWNPVAFLGLGALALFDLYALAVLLLRRPRLRVIFSTDRAKQLARFMVISLLALNWIYLLSHYKAFA
jgi:uncharacterized protein DUF2752